MITKLHKDKSFEICQNGLIPSKTECKLTRLGRYFEIGYINFFPIFKTKAMISQTFELNLVPIKISLKFHLSFNR